VSIGIVFAISIVSRFTFRILCWKEDDVVNRFRRSLAAVVFMSFMTVCFTTTVQATAIYESRAFAKLGVTGIEYSDDGTRSGDVNISTYVEDGFGVPHIVAEGNAEAKGKSSEILGPDPDDPYLYAIGGKAHAEGSASIYGKAETKISSHTVVMEINNSSGVSVTISFKLSYDLSATASTEKPGEFAHATAGFALIGPGVPSLPDPVESGGADSSNSGTEEFDLTLGNGDITLLHIGTSATGQASAIPEPATLIMIGSGLAGVAGYGKLKSRRRKKA
jgi:hypothetical protein